MIRDALEYDHARNESRCSRAIMLGTVDYNRACWQFLRVPGAEIGIAMPTASVRIAPLVYGDGLRMMLVPVGRLCRSGARRLLTFCGCAGRPNSWRGELGREAGLDAARGARRRTRSRCARLQRGARDERTRQAVIGGGRRDHDEAGSGGTFSAAASTVFWVMSRLPVSWSDAFGMSPRPVRRCGVDRTRDACISTVSEEKPPWTFRPRHPNTPPQPNDGGRGPIFISNVFVSAIPSESDPFLLLDDFR